MHWIKSIHHLAPALLAPGQTHQQEQFDEHTQLPGRHQPFDASGSHIFSPE
jgi:hypothetical protein